MSSLVLELQRDALNSSVPVSDLLRKALVVAKKLDLQEFGEWVSLELNGYWENKDDLPGYRIIHGNLRVWNPYRGWQLLIFPDVESNESLSKAYLGYPIGELEEIARNSGKGPVVMNYPENIQAILIKAMPVQLEPGLLIDKTQVHGVLGAVRNIILEWSLKLERQGILGEGMTFSKEEKQAASTVNFNIQNMYHSQIQQGTHYSTQTGSFTSEDLKALSDLIERLKLLLPELHLGADDRAEVDAEMKTIEAQLSSPRPKLATIKQTLRNILEGAAGSILASKAPELLQQIERFISF